MKKMKEMVTERLTKNTVMKKYIQTTTTTSVTKKKEGDKEDNIFLGRACETLVDSIKLLKAVAHSYTMFFETSPGSLGPLLLRFVIAHFNVIGAFYIMQVINESNVLLRRTLRLIHALAPV